MKAKIASLHLQLFLVFLFLSYSLTLIDEKTGCMGSFSPQCELCINGTPICIKCNKAFTASKETCVPNTTATCKVHYCAECVHNDKNLCQVCASGYFMFQEGKKCLLCTVRNCLTCRTKNICDTCLDGYVLSDSAQVCHKDDTL